jgi:hypothetical protein
MKTKHLLILLFTLIGLSLLNLSLNLLRDGFGVYLLEDRIALSILNALIGVGLSYEMARIVKKETGSFLYQILLFTTSLLVIMEYKIELSFLYFVVWIPILIIFFILRDLFKTKTRRLNPKISSNAITYISLCVYSLVIIIERFITKTDLLFPGFGLVLGLFLGFLIQYILRNIKSWVKNFNVTNLM